MTKDYRQVQSTFMYLKEYRTKAKLDRAIVIKNNWPTFITNYAIYIQPCWNKISVFEQNQGLHELLINEVSTVDPTCKYIATSSFYCGVVFFQQVVMNNPQCSTIRHALRLGDY